MENLYDQYFNMTGESRQKWDGWCMDLADKIQHVFDDKPITVVYIEPMESWNDLVPTVTKDKWKYHMACMLHDRVHCMWIDSPLRLEDYLRLMFPGQQLMVTVNNGDLTEELQYWCGGNRHA